MEFSLFNRARRDNNAPYWRESPGMGRDGMFLDDETGATADDEYSRRAKQWQEAVQAGRGHDHGDQDDDDESDESRGLLNDQDKDSAWSSRFTSASGEALDVVYSSWREDSPPPYRTIIPQTLAFTSSILLYCLLFGAVYVAFGAFMHEHGGAATLGLSWPQRPADDRWRTFISNMVSSSLVMWTPYLVMRLMFGSKRMRAVRTANVVVVWLLNPAYECSMFFGTSVETYGSGYRPAFSQFVTVALVFFNAYAASKYEAEGPARVVSGKVISRGVATFYLSMPLLLGIATSLAFRWVLFDVYTHASEKAYFTAIGMPLTSLVFFSIGRFYGMRLQSCHPGTPWTLFVLLYLVFAASSRVLISGLPSVWESAVVTLVFGIVQIIQRATVYPRQMIQHAMIKCQAPERSEIVTDRINRFHADLMVLESITELLGIIFSNGCVLVVRLLYIKQEASEVWKFFAVNTLVQLSVESACNIISVIIEERLGIPILEVWRLRKRQFLALITWVLLCGMVWYSFYATDLLLAVLK